MVRIEERRQSLQSGLRAGGADRGPEPLPPGWSVVPLARVASFSTKPRGLAERQTVPFVAMSDLPAGDVYIANWELRPVTEVRSGVYFQEGDVLLAKITPCLENGKQGLAQGVPGGWGFATTEVYPLHPERLLGEYLAFYLMQPPLRRELAAKMEGTTGRQRLPKMVVESLPVVMPPLPEQRAIAYVLQTVQRARESTEQVLAAARELKRSLLRHLFTYGPVPVEEADQVALKETEIGPVPDSWEIVELGSVLADGPQNGAYKHQSQYGSGTPIVRIDDYDNEGSIVTRAMHRVRLSPDEVRRYRLSTGDILVNRVNSLSHLGKTALIGNLHEPIVFESNMMRLVVKPDRALPEFVFRFLTTPSCRDQLRGKAKRAVAQASVNQGDVQSTPIPVPPIAVQERIALAVAAADSKIAAEQQRRQALDALFKSLLEQLMTGKVRVATE